MCNRRTATCVTILAVLAWSGGCAEPVKWTAPKLSQQKERKDYVFKPNPSTKTLQEPYVGQVGRTGLGFHLASSYSAYRRSATYLLAGDEEGTAELERAGRLVFTKGKYRVIQQLGDAYEVRMLDGPRAGKTGWTHKIMLTNLK